MSVDKFRLALQDNSAVIGQVSGYGAGAAAWLGLAKDVFGLIGIIAGATLSCLVLWDKYQQRRADRQERDRT